MFGCSSSGVDALDIVERWQVYFTYEPRCPWSCLNCTCFAGKLAFHDFNCPIPSLLSCIVKISKTKTPLYCFISKSRLTEITDPDDKISEIMISLVELTEKKIREAHDGNSRWFWYFQNRSSCPHKKEIFVYWRQRSLGEYPPRKGITDLASGLGKQMSNFPHLHIGKTATVSQNGKKIKRTRSKRTSHTYSAVFIVPYNFNASLTPKKYAVVRRDEKSPFPDDHSRQLTYKFETESLKHPVKDSKESSAQTETVLSCLVTWYRSNQKQITAQWATCGSQNLAIMTSRYLSC